MNAGKLPVSGAMKVFGAITILKFDKWRATVALVNPLEESNWRYIFGIRKRSNGKDGKKLSFETRPNGYNTKLLKNFCFIYPEWVPYDLS